MKTIAISRELAHLMDELLELGYQVFFEDEISSPVDVFIYSNHHGEPSLYAANQRLSSISNATSSVSEGYGGTLLIDGRDKSIDQIRYIIENRVYSPIF